MEITVIGVEPPCPRSKRAYEMARELSRDVENATVKKITWDSPEAQRYGRVTTGHHIAQEYGVAVNGKELQMLASQNWSPKVDEVLMPLKQKRLKWGF
jgi:hypothetical protein